MSWKWAGYLMRGSDLGSCRNEVILDNSVILYKSDRH